MDNVIISGIFTLAGVVVGGLFAYLTARDTKKMTRLEDEIREKEDIIDSKEKIIKELNHDINFFYNEEALLLETLSEKENKSAITLKKEYRAEVAEDLGYRLSEKSQPANVQRHM